MSEGNEKSIQYEILVEFSIWCRAAAVSRSCFTFFFLLGTRRSVTRSGRVIGRALSVSRT